MTDLATAETLENLRNVPSKGRLHELIGDLAGKLALDLKHPRRLIIEPALDTIPIKEDGGLDWASVDRIRILSIEEDYH